MPPFLITLVARMGVSQRFQKLAAGIVVLIAVFALVGAGIWAWRAFWHHHDTQVVTIDRATQRADALDATVTADRSAGANQQARDDTNANEQQRLRQAHDQAVSSGSDPWDAISNELR